MFRKSIHHRRPRSNAIAPGVSLGESGRESTRALRVVGIVPSLGYKLFSGSSYIRLMLPLTHGSVRSRIAFSVAAVEQITELEADVVVVQRTAIPREETAQSLVRHCRRRGIRLVYEVDDDLFNLPANHDEADLYREQIRGAGLLAEQADLVTVPTEELAARMRAWNVRVAVVPNALDESLWLDAISRLWRPRSRPCVRILYMGTRTHLQDLKMVEEPIQRLVAESPRRVRFECIGCVPEAMEGSWFRTVRIPWRARQYPGFVRWLRKRARWNIGIAPLEDTPFNRCKSPLKFLDYSALGLVSVCSDVEAYRNVVRHGVNGLLVPSTPEAWYGALKRLIDDDAWRVHLAKKSREEIDRNHTLRNGSVAWLAAYESLQPHRALTPAIPEAVMA